MLIKIKVLPEKVSFTIGLSILLLSPIVLFLLSLLISLDKLAVIIQAIVWGVATLFIVIAADKRQSRLSNKK